MSESNVSYTLSTSGMAVSYPNTSSPKPAPKVLIATLAVETKRGWVGQIVVDSKIAYETKAHKTSQKALTAVNERVVSRLRALFAADVDL
jgi:hypothetical protein